MFQGNLQKPPLGAQAFLGHLGDAVLKHLPEVPALQVDQVESVGEWKGTHEVSLSQVACSNDKR